MLLDASLDTTSEPEKRFDPAGWGQLAGAMSRRCIPRLKARFRTLRCSAHPIRATRAATLFVLCPLLAAADPLSCLPPDLPSTALPAAALTDYRAEISAEFESYFAEVGPHIACLDAERSRTLDEARLATKSYAEFLDTAPAPEDSQ